MGGVSLGNEIDFREEHRKSVSRMLRGHGRLCPSFVRLGAFPANSGALVLDSGGILCPNHILL